MTSHKDDGWLGPFLATRLILCLNHSRSGSRGLRPPLIGSFFIEIFLDLRCPSPRAWSLAVGHCWLFILHGAPQFYYPIANELTDSRLQLMTSVLSDTPWDEQARAFSFCSLHCLSAS